jgi:hypothetical protein
MLAARIEWILLTTGLATAGALAVFVAPAAMTKLLFGRAPSDAVGLLIARHWGLLVGLVGVLLVYAAQHAEVRAPALLVAIAEKVAIAAVILLSPFRRHPAALAAALADAGMAALYSLYLIGV